MNIKQVKIAFLTGFLLLPMLLTGQNKIGFIASERIRAEFEEFKEAEVQLQLDYRKVQEEYQIMLVELDNLKQAYETQRLMSSPEWRKEKEAEIGTKEQRLQQFQAQKVGPEGELYRKQSQMEYELLSKVKTAVDNVAISKGYDLILDGSVSLLYANAMMDLTDDVLFELRNAKDKSFRSMVNKDAIASNKLNKIEDMPEIIIDVDTDIPMTNANQPNTYALIIGNEDYKSKQRGLRNEQNVDYAENDAQIFALYCKKTLGIPHNQIKILKNATSAEISQGLDWINNLSKIERGKARIIFYYSGHGLPHERTKEAYLIPTDVSGTQFKYSIKLNDVYRILTEHPSKQVTVFLDACFSGGARNEGLIAMKGISIRPKENLIPGNLVVFSSSTGEESSAVYREKHHGYFTYYLLKKLKETKGNVDFETLSKYVTESVSKGTGIISKIQTPQVKVSSSVHNKYKKFKLR